MVGQLRARFGQLGLQPLPLSSPSGTPEALSREW